MEMRELSRLARMAASGTVPDEWRQSLPIPIRHRGELAVVFLFAPQVARPGAPNLLGAPDHRVILRVADGKFQLLEVLRPEPLPGIEPDSSGVIGTFGLPEGMTAEEFMQRQEELFAAYDKLLPAFARGDGAEPGPNVREWALYFVKAFDTLSEPPLAPYYIRQGAEFFGWIERAAAG